MLPRGTRLGGQLLTKRVPLLASPITANIPSPSPSFSSSSSSSSNPSQGAPKEGSSSSASLSSLYSSSSALLSTLASLSGFTPSGSPSLSSFSPSPSPPHSEWNEALTSAQSVVGLSGASSSSPVSSVLDPRLLVGKDLEGITENIQELIKTDHPILKTATQYYFDQGGKLLRPLLVLLMASATRQAEGRSLEAMEEIARKQKRLSEITEMIHTASLLHDDVIDTADTRRGSPSANLAFGNKVAVLAGDYLLAKASIALAQLQNLRVVELLATVISNLVEGEVMQMKSDPANLLSFEHYIQKSYLKTAALMAKSCEACVLLGQGENMVQHAQAAYDYGKNLGIAFQIADDVLDFTGSDAELGKPALADLPLGLVTAPVLFAARSQPDLIPLMTRRFQNKGDPQLAREMVMKSDAIEQSVSLANEYVEKAVRAAEKLPDTEARACLINMSQKVVKRKK